MADAPHNQNLILNYMLSKAVIFATKNMLVYRYSETFHMEFTDNYKISW